MQQLLKDSRCISFLRFPMIIGIVLIHSGIEMDYNFSEYVIYDMIVTKGIIGILSRVCVPLFFMISGYLFFYNVKLWNAQTYIYKLKRRGRSLLVPYLFWNTLAIVLFGLIGLIKPNLQSGATPPLQTWNLHVVASLYWSKSPDHIPIVPQFWFIRNLMVVVLFTPVIYWLVKKFNFLLPLVMGILWIMSIGDWDIPGTMCLFFFSLGAWFSIRKSSYVQVGTQLKYIGSAE